MGCHFLLQGIFPTQRWNLCLLHWQADFLPLSHLGSPKHCIYVYKYIYTHRHTYSVCTYIIYMCAQSLSCVQLFATPWTVAHQAPLSMEFSRQEYWSGLPFPSPISYICVCVCVCIHTQIIYTDIAYSNVGIISLSSPFFLLILEPRAKEVL